MINHSQGAASRAIFMAFSCGAFLFLTSCGESIETAAQNEANEIPTGVLNRTTETQAPDLLDLVQMGEAEADGTVWIEARLKPALDGSVELAVTEPKDLQFENEANLESFALTRQSVPIIRRLKIDTSSGDPITVRVSASVKDEYGEVWMSVERVLNFNEVQAEHSSKTIPIVIDLPDGRKIVEYMTREEAIARGHIDR